MSGEAEFIARLRSLATEPASRSLLDDAAVLPVGGETLILTHDMLVEGTHFLRRTDMADVAWKLVATNLSDLAAKGAEPLGVLLGYTLGEGGERFAAGLAKVLDHYGVPLLGGDTVSGKGTRSLGLTAIGRATHLPVPSRTGATAGDTVHVCGTIGDAMLGFEQLTTDAPSPSPLAHRFLRPDALLEEGRSLAPFVTAMMDVSDGLLLDASRIADASGVTLDIDPAAVPLSAEFDASVRERGLSPQEAAALRHRAMTWGDDYALLLTVPAGVTLPVATTTIGKVVHRSEHPILLDGKPTADGEVLGYLHK